MNVETLTTFFGWCTLINIGLMFFSTIALASMRDWAKAVHSKWFGVPEVELDGLYFRYLAYFKIAVIVFNITPYLALKIMA
ncbi:MAG: DUF6868 family protein [Verrucomicrobiota bacterium]